MWIVIISGWLCNLILYYYLKLETTDPVYAKTILVLCLVPWILVVIYVGLMALAITGVVLIVVLEQILHILKR